MSVSVTRENKEARAKPFKLPFINWLHKVKPDSDSALILLQQLKFKTLVFRI